MPQKPYAKPISRWHLLPFGAANNFGLNVAIAVRNGCAADKKGMDDKWQLEQDPVGLSVDRILCAKAATGSSINSSEVAGLNIRCTSM